MKMTGGVRFCWCVFFTFISMSRSHPPQKRTLHFYCQSKFYVTRTHIMVSMLAECGTGCGWVAAVLAALSWGTFGVPLKTKVNVEVNFFVMQSYKTVVCFVTAFPVVFLLGERIQFTPWGILSGLFWVPGASCGIYGIRNGKSRVS
jgi:hypothetical protein